MNDRVTAIILALIVQLAVSAVLVPWDAVTEVEFYSGAKMALALGLLANVLARLMMMRWAARTPAPRPRPRTSRDPARGEIGGFWYVLTAFAFALISTYAGVVLTEARLADATAASLVCVLLHQIVFATIAFHVQQRTARSRFSRAVGLLAISGAACFFALFVPSLFRQIDSGGVASNDVTDAVLAIPVILIALVGIVRVGTSGSSRQRSPTRQR